MFRLAFRNFFQNKIRLVISSGGVSLALLLILSLDAIFTGVEQQNTAFIDNSGANVIVSQEGVRNLHMASSSLDASVTNKVRALPGVEAVTPILYLSNMIVIGEDRNLAYIIGLPEDAEMGGPWEVAVGTSQPGTGEAVIDQNVAEQSGIGIGDQVEILGEELEVIGLSTGTANLVNSVAFISMDDFASLRGWQDTISFLFVKVSAGVEEKGVVQRVAKRLRDATVQTRQEFSRQERQVIKDMSTDVITMMNLIGFFIGLAVLSLTVYTATLSRRKEYGMLKALGARNSHLYGVVLAQALLSIVIGFGLGVAATLLLSTLIPRLGLNLRLQISNASLLKVSIVSILIAAFSAALPIHQIARLDPAMVFRGK